MIDFVAVLLSYAISGERTLEAFYERVPPFAHTFMALFGRERLPHRSTLSRFLAALDQAQARSMTYVVSRRSLGSPAGKIGAARWVVGSTGNPLGGVRCRWHRGRLLANELYLARLVARQHNAG